MAVRLPVVVCQSRHPSARSQQFEESLVAALMFQSGMDATFIDSLDQLAHDSTDHLCLQGLLGDFALVTWLPDDQIEQDLNRLGIACQLLPRGVANPMAPRVANVAGSHLKKVYHVSLRNGHSPEQVLAILSDLHRQRNLQVVPLQLARPPESHGQVNTVALQGPKPESAPAIPAQTQPVSESAAEGTPSSQEVSWDELDRLVDELDRSQL